MARSASVPLDHHNAALVLCRALVGCIYSPCCLRFIKTAVRVIAHHGVTALISLYAKVLPHQWDSKKLRVINHPDEMLMNLHITHTKQLIDTAILSLAHEGCLDTMKASEVKSRVLDKLKPERVEVRENEEFKAT